MCMHQCHHHHAILLAGILQMVSSVHRLDKKQGCSCRNKATAKLRLLTSHRDAPTEPYQYIDMPYSSQATTAEIDL